MNVKPSKLWSSLALIIALVFVSGIGGCQPKCPKPSENIPGTEDFRPDCPFEETQATTTGPRALDVYVLHDNTDAFREQIQAFQSQNPGLQVRVKKFVNPAEYKDLVIGEIADGEGPDVFMIHNTWMPEFQKKVLPLPLNQPIVMNADLFRQTFFAAAADDLIIDEQIYGMPLSVDNLAVYYNKQVFRDLLATTDHPADLWEGIQEQVFNLTKRDNSPERFALAGIAMGRADNISSAVDILYALMLQYGVQLYDDKQESAIFANPQGSATESPGIQAFTLFTSFALPSYKNYSWNDTITGFAPAEKEVNPFIRGKVAMILGYPYLYQQIVTGIQNAQKAGTQHIALEDVGVAPFPQLVTAQEATRRDTLASYFPLVVARTSDMPTEAWSFIQYLTSADALQTYHAKTNRPTSRKDMVQQQSTEPIFGTFAYQASFAKSYKIFDDEAYRKVFTDAIQEVVRNVASPREALTTAQNKITCLLRKQKGISGSDVDCGI